MTISPNVSQGAAGEADVRRVRRDIAWACRILAERGYHDLTLGHVSARDPRDPEQIWIKRRGVTLAEVEIEDVIELRLDGDPREAGKEMHLEAVLHTEVYRRRPDVGAVVHGHPPYATAFGATDGELLNLTHDAVMFHRGLSFFDDNADLITEPEQGLQVAEALGDSSVVLLRNHGVLVAQANLAWMVLAAVTLERAVMLQSIASTLGRARPIDPETVEALSSHKYDDQLVEEYWQAWIREMTRQGIEIEGG